MAQFKDQALLVSGAGGNLGRLAVEELIARGATKIIAGTRDPATLSDFAAKGVEVRRIDFDDADLAQALAGVDRMLLVSTSTPNRLAQQRHAVDAARLAGVKHIVYTSAPNPRPDPEASSISDHYWTEQAIAASGLDFTLLRNHIYADFIPFGVPGVEASGQLFDAADGKGRSYVTRADTARTAAGALLDAAGKQIHDVTGPAALTQDEIAALLSKVYGKTVTRVGISTDELRDRLQTAGLPPFMTDLLVAFEIDAANGHHAVVTDAVERFSGRKPTPAADIIGKGH